MIDHAGLLMTNGNHLACERIQGVNDNMIKSHFHDYYELYYLESGNRNHMIQNQLYNICANEFIIFPPYVMHHSYGDADMPFTRLLLYFKSDLILLPDMLEEPYASAPHVYRPDSKTSHEIRHMLNNILGEYGQKPPYYEFSAQMMLNRILSLALRCQKVKPTAADRMPLSDILDYLHAHFTEDISLQTLSNVFYISQYHLCREFKRYTNSTIIQYLNSLRIIEAQKLLSETDMSVTDIGKQVGFSSLTHFGRIFKSVTGVSPKQWKNISRP